MKSYRVSGMTCQGCVNSITRAIKALAPQAAVEVDLAGGKVRVSDAVDAEVVAQAAANAGFEFGGEEAMAHAGCGCGHAH